MVTDYQSWIQTGVNIAVVVAAAVARIRKAERRLRREARATRRIARAAYRRGTEALRAVDNLAAETSPRRGGRRFYDPPDSDH